MHVKRRPSGRLKNTGPGHGVAKLGRRRGRIERAVKKTLNRRKLSGTCSRFLLERYVGIQNLIVC
jgi:hypothetical protein